MDEDQEVQRDNANNTQASSLMFTLHGLMVIKELFENRTLPPHFVEYFPRFGNHVGSLIANDRRMEFVIQNTTYRSAKISKPKNPDSYYVDLDDLEEGEALLEAISALKEVSPVKLAKHHIFTVFFIMQNIDVIGTDETLYDAFTTGNTEWNSVDPNDEALAAICEAVVDKSLTRLFMAFKKFLVRTSITSNQNDIEDAYLKPLREKDFEKLNQQPLIGFFQYESPELPGVVLPSAYHELFDGNRDEHIELRENMIEFLTEEHDMDVTKTNLQAKLDMINPYKCTTVKLDDEPTIGIPFAEYTFANAGMFRHFREGYCYTGTYLATMIVGNRGNLDLKGLAVTPELKKEIVSFIASYLVGPGLAEQSDILLYLSHYTPHEHEILHRAIDMVGNGPLDTTKNRIIEEDANFTKEELVVLFRALLDHFSKEMEMKSVYVIMKYSANTIFEILGLLGYIMLSDDVTVGDNANGRNFHISQYCTGILLDVFDKCQKIHIKEGTLYDELMKVTFHNESLKSLLNDLSSTCIHGMGRRFISFYLNAYKASRSFVEDLIACRKRNKDLAVADLGPEDASMHLLAPWKVVDSDKNEYEYDDDAYVQQVEKAFALLPMFIELPATVAQDIGYKFLTCVNYEFVPAASGYVKHPLNKYAIVGGFRDDGIFHWIVNMDGSTCFKSGGDENSPLFYMDPHGGPVSVSPKDYVSPQTFDKIFRAMMHDKKDKDMLFKRLQHIPYVFQKDRKAMFAAFANFTLHMCRFMSHRTSTNEQWKMHYANILQRFGYDEYLFEPIFPKYIAACTEEGTLWSNALQLEDPNASVRIESPKFVGSLENFLSLPYKVNDENEVIVTDVRGGDLTKAYQQCKLLGRILNPSKPLSNGEQRYEELFSTLEGYMTLVYRQGSELRQNVFRSVEISYNGQTIGLSNPNEANAFITKVKSANPQDAATLLSLWKRLQTIDVVNAPMVIVDLFVDYASGPSKFSSIIENVLVQLIHICISLQLLSYAYFLALLPINDPMYASLQQTEYYTKTQYVIDELIPNIMAWKSRTEPTQKLVLDLIKNYHRLTIDIYCFALNPEYNPSVYNSTELSFQTLSEEHPLLYKLRRESALLGTRKQRESDLHMVTGRTIDVMPTMYERYDFTLPFLQNTFVYNNVIDGKSVLEHGDYQDSLPTRFNYLLRSETLENHSRKFVGFAQFEKIMNHILAGDPGKVVIEDKTIVEYYLEKYNEDAKVNKWKEYTSTQEILTELIINVITPLEGVNMYTSKLENYLTNLLAELLTSTIDAS